jgi:general secretion pathway protein H
MSRSTASSASSSATAAGGVAIPGDVSLDVMGVNETWAGRRSLVRFETDGSSSGTVIKLAREGFGYEIRVNWYTGGVTLVEP